VTSVAGRDRKIVMQLTLTHDSMPALYEALEGLAARRRVDRIKDLAKLGLVVERAGQGISVGQHHDRQPAEVAAGVAPPGTAAALLDWTDDSGE
jgi:hypothetical protein